MGQLCWGMLWNLVALLKSFSLWRTRGMALPAPAQTSLALVFLALAAVRELSWWVRPAAPTAVPAVEA